jgi:hypothetical protein
VAGVWRRLHTEELNNLYASTNIRVFKSRGIKLAGKAARIGEMRNEYKISVEKPEGKRPLGRPRRRWKDNIRKDLREMGWEDVDWIHLIQDMTGSCEHGNEPSGSIKGGEFLD